MSVTRALAAYGTFAVVKAAALATVATLLNVAFWRALILLAISAVITGVFGVAIAIVQARYHHQIDQRLDELEHKGEQTLSKLDVAAETAERRNG